MPTRDNDFDRLDPAEYPEPDSDDRGQMSCPSCGGSIYDDSVRCPLCGAYVTESGRKPLWIVAGLVVCLAMAFYWAFWG